MVAYLFPSLTCLSQERIVSFTSVIYSLIHRFVLAQTIFCLQHNKIKSLHQTINQLVIKHSLVLAQSFFFLIADISERTKCVDFYYGKSYFNSPRISNKHFYKLLWIALSNHQFTLTARNKKRNKKTTVCRKRQCAGVRTMGMSKYPF